MINRVWRASLDLRFRYDGVRTVIDRRKHFGPLRIQKPFYPEDGACHTYILHPPGGIAGGDELNIRAEVKNKGAALLTTPASAKIYRSARSLSKVSNTLSLGDDSSLEWLPQDTVLFGGSRLEQATRINATSQSRFLVWEISSLGREASGDRYEDGELEQFLQINIDGLPRLIERQSWSAGDLILSSAWGLNGNTAFGSLYGFPADQEVLHHTRQILNKDGFNEMAATLVDDILVVRGIAMDAVRLRNTFVWVWSQLRQFIAWLQPSPPRIWAT